MFQKRGDLKYCMLLFFLVLIPTVFAYPVEDAFSEAEEYLFTKAGWSMNEPAYKLGCTDFLFINKFPILNKWIYVNSSYCVLQRICFRPEDPDRTLILHEYAHAILEEDDLYHLTPPYALSDFFKDHGMDKEMNSAESAFNEGWASSFSMAVRKNSNVYGWNLENQTYFIQEQYSQTAGNNYQLTTSNEALTALILLDIIDDKNFGGGYGSYQNIGDDDQISSRFDLLFDVLRYKQPRNIFDFYGYWMDDGEKGYWVGKNVEYENLKNELYEIFPTQDRGLETLCMIMQSPYYYDISLEAGPGGGF